MIICPYFGNGTRHAVWTVCLIFSCLSWNDRSASEKIVIFDPPFFVMGRRVHAAEKDYVMAVIERLFIVSLRCEMKMKQAKVISISSAGSSTLSLL